MALTPKQLRQKDEREIRTKMRELIRWLPKDIAGKDHFAMSFDSTLDDLRELNNRLRVRTKAR